MFGLFDGMQPADQFLHGMHFMLCIMALLVALLPALAEKGGTAHRFGGMLYIPVAVLALMLASFMAWREMSSLLFCFNSFCAYLLLSGWRAVHEKDAPALIDWVIPGCLFVLAVAVVAHGLLNHAAEGEAMRKKLYLNFFALNAFFLSWRDWRHLQRRAQWSRHKIFLGTMRFGSDHVAMAWMGRHVAGMVGSVTANLSVVVLTLLPSEWHWLWPAALIVMALYVAWQQHEHKMRLRLGSFDGLRTPLPRRQI